LVYVSEPRMGHSAVSGKSTRLLRCAPCAALTIFHSRTSRQRFITPPVLLLSETTTRIVRGALALAGFSCPFPNTGGCARSSFSLLQVWLKLKKQTCGSFHCHQ